MPEQPNNGEGDWALQSTGKGLDGRTNPLCVLILNTCSQGITVALLGNLKPASTVLPGFQKRYSLVLFPHLCLKKKHSIQRGEDLLKAPHFLVKTHSKPLGSWSLQKC